ncbi:MAG: Inositol-1-monophosphatase [Candidatus Hydrogenedentes bacterium ADurb.Bin101]|nr:MAG: Inositol-1-monophosphatase [Candidatus Hydrogenedentes bacterium ADurb.Bin101]
MNGPGCGYTVCRDLFSFRPFAYRELNCYTNSGTMGKSEDAVAGMPYALPKSLRKKGSLYGRAAPYEGVCTMLELDFIQTFLNTNRDYVLEKYRDKTNLTVTNKQADPNNLLTEVDLTVQKRFVDAVQDAFPGDLIVGEESGLDRAPDDLNQRIWVIDPIDGTYNFMRGLNPAFAISIAFVEEGFARAAGVLLPLQGTCFLAEAGQGATCDGRRLSVSKIQHMEEACFEIDFSNTETRRMLLRRGTDILKKAGRVRSQGSAVVGICQVATGDVDAYLHMGLQPWDYAAAQLIAEEAGALATRLDGKALRVFDNRKGVLITNGAIHRAALSLVAS